MGNGWRVGKNKASDSWDYAVVFVKRRNYPVVYCFLICLSDSEGTTISAAAEYGPVRSHWTDAVRTVLEIEQAGRFG